MTTTYETGRLHVIHADPPAKGVANDESITITSPDPEQHRQPVYSFSHERVADDEFVSSAKADTEHNHQESTHADVLKPEQASDANASEPLKQDLKAKR